MAMPVASRGYYGGLVRSGVGALSAAYGAYKGWNAGKGLASRNKKSRTGFITQQYDVKTQYRRKRMPRRKRKRWMRQVRKVNHIVDNRLGSQYQMFRSFATGTNSNGTQSFLSAGLFGENGTPATAFDMGIDDLYNLNLKNGDTGKINKFHIKSGVLDIELTNLGGEGYNNSLTADVYEIVCRKDLNTQGTTAAAGPSDLMNDGFADQDLLGSNTALGATLPGVTPFQNAEFCRHFKIIKKTRVLLSVGQTTHFMLRDAKNRTYRYDSASRPVCSVGWYHGYLIIIQGVVDIGNYASACKYAMTGQRYYDYVQSEVNSVRAGYSNT